MEHINYLSITTLIVFSLLLSDITGSINAQTDSDGSSPQFLYPEFSEGILKMRNGKSQNAIMNYNMVSEKMVYEKDDIIYDLISTVMIDTIFIRNNCFIPVGKIFHEVVVVAPISLFIQHRASLIPPGKPAGYGGTSQTSSIISVSSISTASGYYNLKLPSDYTVKVDPVYWIRKDNEMFSFINERQLLKIFPEQANKLKQFIKKGRIKLDRKEDVKTLIGYCNELIR